MLKVNNLKKSFGKNEVLKELNLEIKNGEIVVIVGPSGGGKTTLLRCVTGLENCDNGSIKINDRYICENGVYKTKKEFNEIRKDVGLVFQSFNLFPHMTVMENIIEGQIKVLSKSKESSIKIGKDILEFLGLTDKGEMYPYQLSGGQKQRVAIGRALALNPKLMCFDEPTSALDPGLTEEVAKLIRSLSKDGMSMLIISHDMNFAKLVADKIYSMDKGILREGNIF